MPAGQHTAAGTHAFQPSGPHVADLHLGPIAGVARAYDRAVETKTRRPGLVEPRVVDARHRDVLGARAGDGAWDQPMREQSGDGRVAVGKMEERRAWARARVEPHPRPRRGPELHAREARQTEAPGVQRGDGVDAEAIEGMRARLEERQHVGMAAGALHQEVGVAHPREARLLRPVVEPREIVAR